MKKGLTILLGFTGGLIGAFVYGKLYAPVVFTQLESTNMLTAAAPIKYQGQAIAQANFVNASQIATPSVVFIKTLSNQQTGYNDPFIVFWNNFDFIGQSGPVTSSGSGVILTADGYIVTNLHVVKDANQIEVITNNNKRSYQAKIIGTDPSTDLALIKIQANNLPHLTMGNSDQVEIGEWVLAVGNPFNLTSTVTAGIVSAKGRNINIVNNQFPIESFIQTDAAINPGNSGGALVDLDGKLIGINTAIASNTGSYNGYGFAIPVNIVAKIIKDLIEFKEVQRGFTGMEIKDIDATMAETLSIKNNHGVLVNEVLEGGPADKAGIQKGDVVIEVNNKPIDSKANFDEQIAYGRPGDKLTVKYLRKGLEKITQVALLNEEGTTAIMKKGTVSSGSLGADFQLVSKAEKDKLGILQGIKISNIRNGRIAMMGIQEGFIILKFNKKEYDNVASLIADFEAARGQIQIEGMFPNGSRAVYSFYN
jgi:Do/DeqQ family serine protease